MANHKNHLNHSYQLDSVSDTQALYSDWAATYDAEIIDNGYITPQRCADALTKVIDSNTLCPIKCTIKKSELSVLDIGCGTGLSGKVLFDYGFSNLSACDINPEMLEIAKSRGIYQTLWLSDIENPFPFTAGTYDVITAVGVIGAGAAPLEVFHSAINKLASGGLFVFSFNDHTLEDPAYEDAINKEVMDTNFELIFKEYGEHLPRRKIKSIVYVMRKI